MVWSTFDEKTDAVCSYPRLWIVTGRWLAITRWGQAKAVPRRVPAAVAAYRKRSSRDWR